MRENEELREKATLRYEERITELHSVIAELNKKIDRLQGSTIREEDEYLEQESELSASQADGLDDSQSLEQEETPSLPENQSTMVAADADGSSDLNSELQRVLSGLESAVCGRKKSGCSISAAEVERHMDQLTAASEHCDLAIKTVEELEGELGQDVYPSVAEERARWEKELAGLRDESAGLAARLCSSEDELGRTRASAAAVREERDRLRRRVRELQTRLQSVQAAAPASPGRLGPTSRAVNPSTGELSTSSSSNDLPVAKVAERVKLSKTRLDSGSPADRPVLGSEISSIGVSSSVAEHLAHSLQDCSNIQEIFQTLCSHGSSVSESKLREFEVEMERLNSRIEHLKSQNDLLTITLEECKNNAERMSMLVGKHESNSTALRLALQYSEQCIEAYEALMALAESEQGLILGQFQAAGVGSVAEQPSGGGGGGSAEDASRALRKAREGRRVAEAAARALLARLDGVCGAPGAVGGAQPWESLSSHSQTSTTSSTASSCDADLSKEDEQRLRDYAQQLRADCAAVTLTMLELESVHLDALSCDVKSRGDGTRLDLENAVLMQELMAMKEEMAELKAQLYLVEKERKALELKLSTREAQEQAYLVHIEHLKSEVEEQREQRSRSLGSGSGGTGGTGGGTGARLKTPKENGETLTAAITLAELRSPLHDNDLANELSDALHREKKLKVRVQELVAALEKLTRSSEIRHQQSAEFVNDLKRANSNLIAAYEKTKKKYQSKVKRLEAQMVSMVERHETQARMLKQRIALLEEENARPPANETSL
ncbi:colorectal mutant cancer protein-like [Lethenteron reissneri]|uniref:colorectal mutant cancer protein-like n=1 Tax=Lethenteron reissneri TaxID=7753 RepID=UPI002AB616BA|nr:colorectal mutant cancer protein-like [Lethenteron reissneri]